MEGVAINQEHR